MRTQRWGGALLIACLAACGGECPAADAAEAAQAAQAAESPRASAADATHAAAEMFKRAATERGDGRAGEAAATAGAARLQEALPGGVLPEFDYVLGSDLATRHAYATRTVTLRARGVDAREALDALAGGFTGAGFEAGAVASDKATLLQEFWTPGAARGVAAVSAGGTRIGVMARDYAPDSESAREGYPALVVVTVNSP